MFELNLIQNKIDVFKKKRKIIHIVSIVCIVELVIIFLIFFRFIFLSRSISLLEKKEQNIKALINEQLSKYAVVEFEKEWNEYLNSLKNIDRMFSERSFLTKKIDEIISILPPNTCIDRISFNMQTKNFKIDILAVNGDISAFDIIKDYISNLEKSPFIGQGAKMESHQRIELEGQKIEYFTISLPSVQKIN